MKRQILSTLLLSLMLVGVMGCSNDDYHQIEDTISVDLQQVPYPKLSDYHFFVANIKELIPNPELLLYKPNSELFTDYAQKSRYVWIPKNSKAIFIDENEPLELPIGSVLIKNIYYDANQLGDRKVLESRLMIRKETGWIFANYLWNDEQTEAYYNTTGGPIPLSINHKGESLDINYLVPSTGQCNSCHNLDSEIVPIGIKPIHLNYTLNGANQLQNWIQKGYLQNNLPENIGTVVDYTDTSKPLDERVRSYLDMQCAYCHRDGGGAYYVTIRLPYHQTTNPDNIGICQPSSMQPPGISHGRVIDPKNPDGSVLLYMMRTNDPMFKMPRIGRSTIHQEGVALIEEWINSLELCP